MQSSLSLTHAHSQIHTHKYRETYDTYIQTHNYMQIPHVHRNTHILTYSEKQYTDTDTRLLTCTYSIMALYK